ncbi:hypothetical protein HA151_06065 [Prochlorococcus marinus XMU1419]|uniref:tetratricopeptide repeat-containing sulfotransferase family protein n=1 Tax=Prochlorococcus marinus TaxID=1219 RepID=UPI001AD9DDF8|nr:tetratricopeptide repeat-containing sulfotransferase family protein [Prochlorococcus marinus]MBO8234082.1 hypothetical protein [Prochlorococcus marinus XMU1419]MBW3077544.1 hypothetical protein [Prochlorococcus marinus str. XMU1419]
MKGFKESEVNKMDRDKKQHPKNNNKALFQNALTLQKKGELEEASKIYHQLIKNKFLEEKVFLNYATICQQQNKFNDAILLLKNAIKINPKNFIPFFKMGFILNNRGRFYEAYPFAKKAIDLNPSLWEGYHNLIKILISLNKPKDAAIIAEKARNMFSNNHLFDGLLGDIYKDIGDFEEAKKNYNKAINKAPSDDETLYSYADFLVGIGRKEESINYLKKILNINPKHSISYYLLSTIVSPEKDQNLVNIILNTKITNFNTIYDKYTILFSKANIFHKKRNFEKSSELLKQANDFKLLDRPSNIERVIKYSELIKEKTNLDKSFDIPKFNFLRDIFIVGLPRSGSTLVESILGMNQDVYNLGENSILINALKESEESNYSNIDQLYFKFSQNFSKKKITTNKMLGNFMHIPHIVSKLEHSKIIYTFRNPLDNILSMYRAKFTGAGNEYSSSLIDTANYYVHHFKMMSFYREKYKNHIYFLNYDKLVNDPETQIKKILDWLGISWSNNYLNHHKSEQGFFTASNVEVRSPINNKSVGGWKNYSKLMREPLEFFQLNNFALDSFEKYS